MENTTNTGGIHQVLKPIELVPLAYAHCQTEEEGSQIGKAKVGQIIWTDNNEYLFLEKISNEDAYQALEFSTKLGKEPNCVGIYLDTSGWACPINDDGSVPNVKPSEHDERFRVRLVSIITNNGFSSAVGMYKDGETEEVTYDEGSGEGALHDALELTWSLMR